MSDFSMSSQSIKLESLSNTPSVRASPGPTATSPAQASNPTTETVQCSGWLLKRELEDPICGPDGEKRQKTTVALPVDDDEGQHHPDAPPTYALLHWVKYCTWPVNSFNPAVQTWQAIEDSPEDTMKYPDPPEVHYYVWAGSRYPRRIAKTAYDAERRSNSSLIAPRSNSSLTAPRSNPNLTAPRSDPSLADPTPIGSPVLPSLDIKSSVYEQDEYETLLAAKSSFMYRAQGGINNRSKKTCADLLSTAYNTPAQTLFDDDVFEDTFKDLRSRNNAKVIQDISRLLVPSAETLAKLSDKRLHVLTECVDDTWTQSIAFHGPKPKPGYSVGFRRSAFTQEQLQKLDHLIGTVFDTSYFVATCQMYFPFLTCEVSKEWLDLADRQNAHSMTVAVRGVVELYRAVGRHEELDREILGFSISHDQESVRIYGHYAVIEGPDTSYYRHTLHQSFFTEENGKKKWTAYCFTRSIYDLWMPTHLERICSAIEDLPCYVDLKVPSLPDMPYSPPDDFQALQANRISEPMFDA